MELNDWNSDLMTVEETARLLHVPQQYAVRPAECAIKPSITEFSEDHGGLYGHE